MKNILSVSKDQIIEDLILLKNKSEEEALKVINKINELILCGHEHIQKMDMGEDTYYFITKESEQFFRDEMGVNFYNF